jgi:hypothetical protein
MTQATEGVFGYVEVWERRKGLPLGEVRKLEPDAEVRVSRVEAIEGERVEQAVALAAAYAHPAYQPLRRICKSGVARLHLTPATKAARRILTAHRILTGARPGAALDRILPFYLGNLAANYGAGTRRGAGAPTVELYAHELRMPSWKAAQ